MVSKRGVKSQRERGEGSFLPDFCRIRMVFGVVITAELLAVVLTLASIDSLNQFSEDLSLRSLYIQWIALGMAGLLCILRSWLGRLSHTLAGVIAWLILIFLTLCVTAVSQLVLDDSINWSSVIRSLGISGIGGAMLLRYLYIQHLWRRQVEAESQARFQALQSRIRPHFLFNSMNTIAHLTRANPKLAEEVVEDLADLFRASLADASRRSTLADELDLCRRYLRIEAERLGERLRVEWDLEGLPEQAPLPALVLQPLLENAVYHGIEPAMAAGRVVISGRYSRGRVNLSIRNTLPHRVNGNSHRKGNSMALENTRQRLKGFFDEEASLTVAEVDGEHQVRVVFPYPMRVT